MTTMTEKSYRVMFPKGRVQQAFDERGPEAALRQAKKDDLNPARVQRWFRMWSEAAKAAKGKRVAAAIKAPVASGKAAKAVKGAPDKGKGGKAPTTKRKAPRRTAA